MVEIDQVEEFKREDSFPLEGETVVSTTRKRSREKNQEEEEEIVEDPLIVFGSDILLMILNNLDARGIANCLLVSSDWQRIASSDKLWTSKVFATKTVEEERKFFEETFDKMERRKPYSAAFGMLEELWLEKAHIPRSSQVRGMSKLAAYSFSVIDGERNRIMKEDLCDHAWEFRYKKMAPEYWRNLDPSWKGTGPPMRRYFHPDGSQSADPGDPVWGGHECCYSIVTSFVGEGRIRKHYVRINRWPHMIVRRKQDWSWEMANHLCYYTSIPDADKVGGTGPLFPVW